MPITDRAPAQDSPVPGDLSGLLGDDSNVSPFPANNRAVALDLARRGFAVFTITKKNHGGWTPISDWRAASTIDRDQISKRWRDSPNPRVRLPAGERNSIRILDIDRKNGKDGFATLAPMGSPDGESLSSVRVRTPSGGAHVIFAHAPGRKDGGGGGR